MWLWLACGGVSDPDVTSPQEVITAVELSFTDAMGTTVARWSDPEGDGDPDVDAVTLGLASVADVAVTFWDGDTEITPEILEEAADHQVFVTGSAAAGTTTWMSTDEDANGLPLGLSWTAEALASGSGDLTVTLRHLPPEGGEAVKVAGLQEVASTEGLDALPGDSDASVTFPLTVP